MKKMLKRDVYNEPLLDLVFFLIDTFEEGLSIGSYLSQFLANYYLSKAYTYAGQLCKVRHKKDGTVKRVPLVCHVLFQMDDILFLGHSRKDVEAAAKKFEKYINTELHLELKDTARIIDLSTEYIDILGRKISRKNLTIRSSTFLKARRAYKKAYSYVCHGEEIPLKLAWSCISRYGPIKHTDSKRFRRRYHVEKVNEQARKVVSRYAKRRIKHENDEFF